MLTVKDLFKYVLDNLQKSYYESIKFNLNILILATVFYSSLDFRLSEFKRIFYTFCIQAVKSRQFNHF